MPTQLDERARWLFAAIVESIFIESGDDDYLAARILWDHRLTRSYLWHAAQALEKYLKAACLINGKEAKFGHQITHGFASVMEFAPELVPDRLLRPDAYTHKEPENFTEKTEEFVARMEELGSPNSRYRETEVFVNSYDIVKLDLFCKAIRRLTINLDEMHGKFSARYWLAKKPNQITRPFFSEPDDEQTKRLLEKGNFAWSDEPDENPEFHVSWSAQGIMRAYAIDADVRAAVSLLASRSHWKEEYLLEKVLIKSR